MLDTFRNLIKGWLGKVLITIFILPFAFFGVSSIFQSAGVDNNVATVNGSGIDERELNRAIEMQRQSLISRFGEQLPKDFLSVENLRPNVLNGMIDRELLTQYADDSKHYIGLEGIHKEIRGSSTFHQDGVFSDSLFEQLIQRAGMNPSQFIDELRKDKKGDQVREGYFKTEFATSVEVEQLIRLNEQRRDISYLQIPLNKVKDEIEVSEKEIERYFDENRDQYKVPEQVALEYIELKKENFLGDITVSEEDVSAQYAIHVAEVEASQTRDASHILIEISEDRDAGEALVLAESIHEKLLAGEEFSSLAKAYSADTGSAEKGGQLGFAGREVYVEAFEEALFSLGVGEVSGPVLTEFGYHIIKLHEVEPALPKLEDVRESMVEAVRLNKAEQPFYDKVEELKDVVFASSDLQDPAELLGATVKHTGYFTRSGGVGISANRDVVAAAFAEDVLIERRNSEVIEIETENKVVVVRVKEHKPESYKELDAVRLPIKLAIESDKGKLRLKELGDELLEKVRSDQLKDEDIVSLDVKWLEKKAIKRNEAGVPRDIAKKAFALPKKSEQNVVADGISLSGGDYVIIRLDAVVDENNEEIPETIAQKKQQMASVLGEQKGQSAFMSVTAWLRDSANIKEM